MIYINVLRAGMTLIAVTGWLMMGSAEAANWYVRPSAAGSNDGTSWSNAWSMDGINWNGVQAGDTIWLAGGTYNSGMTISASGANGNPISIRRTLATDQAAVASPGWNSSFDSQVVMSQEIYGDGIGNITIDGRVADGILNAQGNDGFAMLFANSGNNISVQYVTMTGPGWGQYSGYGINLIGGSGHYLGHCKFNGITQELSWSVDGGIVEYCTFMNAGPGTSSAHSDMIYCGSPSNSIFRYNYFYNSYSQAFFFDGGGSSGIYVYGNIADQGPLGTGTWLETKQGYTWGDFHIYNNTILGWAIGVQLRGTSSVTNEIVNNLFVNTSWSKEGVNVVSDFNGYTKGVAAGDGAHSISNAANPLQSPSSGNYQLLANSWPINKGEALATNGYINKDATGNARGAAGAWDLGAYEYVGTSTLPNPPTNLRLLGSL